MTRSMNKINGGGVDSNSTILNQSMNKLNGGGSMKYNNRVLCLVIYFLPYIHSDRESFMKQTVIHS